GSRTVAGAFGGAAGVSAGGGSAGLTALTAGNDSGRCDPPCAKTVVALASTSIAMQKSRCTVLSGWMGDASRFMKPVNVFPSVETTLHCLNWMRQSLVAYRRFSMLQVIRPGNL